MQSSMESVDAHMFVLFCMLSSQETLQLAQFKTSEPQISAALLKAIARKSHINANAVVLTVHENLSKLGQHMNKVSRNIEEFNDHVAGKVGALAARGEKSLNTQATHLPKGCSSWHLCLHHHHHQCS